jgi:S-formylglutathione hydrolase
MTTETSSSPTITRSEQRCFGETQGFYEHESESCAGPMRFSVFVPPGASKDHKVPAVYFLAGLTCTEETFVIKAGAQRAASELGLAIVTCDTSPRSKRYAGDDASWDFGQGAGFYLDATEQPWSESYRMESYVTRELRAAVEASFPVQTERRAIMGHSMGGHGALVLALRNQGLYDSVSALAPIVAPSQVPWGQKAFAGYLGDSQARWRAHDACALVASATIPSTILVDVGAADKFLERELRPELFVSACKSAGQSLELTMRDGYDHSYYFVQSFVEAHLRHHAAQLSKR